MWAIFVTTIKSFDLVLENIKTETDQNNNEEIRWVVFSKYLLRDFSGSGIVLCSKFVKVNQTAKALPSQTFCIRIKRKTND